MELATNQPKESDFIGRQTELAMLTAALDEAVSGQGQMVMLAGEPGIGKTRLAQELVAQAGSLGAQIFWGWCYEHAGAPPYWPYVHPIRTYIESVDAGDLSSLLGLGGEAIAEIVPELREKLPDLAQPAVAEPEQARFRLFDSVATFLKNASHGQPIVFVVDDLHWADSSSLLMLEFLVREITASSVLVIGTYRDIEITASHPLTQTLGNLVRERHYRRVQLDGLTQEEVGAFVAGAKGVSLAGEILETIHRRTDGNPLFVNEVVELINPVEMTEIKALADIIPDGVRDAISGRLSRLSETCNQVLGTASVIGREFDLSLLRASEPGLGGDGVLEALDAAMETRVIEEIPGSVGRYQFSHALVQQVLYGDMSSTRRLRAHVGIGEALEEMHGSNLEGYAAELARHFAEAASVSGPEKLVRYSLMAGVRALATYAYEDARDHFERGLAARDIDLSGTEPAPDGEASDLLFGWAKAQASVGVGIQLSEASIVIGRAFEYYAESGDVDQAVAAAEFRVAPPAYVLPGVTQLIARALTLVPDDSHQAARLLSRYGGILGVAELDYDGANQALQQAIAIARRENDAALEVQALGYLALVGGLHVKWQDCLTHGQRAIELAGRENDILTLGPRFWAAVSLQGLGDLDAARPHALVLRDLAERSSTSRIFFGRSFGPITNLMRLEGNWDAGRENSDKGLEASPSDPTLLETRILLEYETGEAARGEFFLKRIVESIGRPGPDQSLTYGRASMAVASVARITGNNDRLESAEEAAQMVVSAPNISPRLALNATVGLALLAVAKEDRAKAEEHYAGLLWQKGTMVWAVISVDRLLGLLTHTIGNHDQAVAHFDDALTFCRKAGYRPELAWTCCDYADTLFVRDSAGDETKAASLLGESLGIATEFGMRPLMERVAARQQMIPTRSAQTTDFPDGLTVREVEVIRLVAVGKTDREIAEDLFISFRTVGNHVRSILNKTGAANRTEAAAYAVQNGLTGGNTSTE